MTDVRRAYGILEIKSFDSDQGIVEGTATSIAPDRMGDVVEPKGAQYKLPLPLLSQHMSTAPVGHVVKARGYRDRIDISAKLADPSQAQSETVRERLRAAWDDVKLGLVRGFSIGFRSIKEERIEDTYSYRFLEWEWLETSLVSIPANSEATIQVVKSLDDARRVALDQRRGIVRLGPDIQRRARRQHHPGAVYLDLTETRADGRPGTTQELPD